MSESGQGHSTPVMSSLVPVVGVLEQNDTQSPLFCGFEILMYHLGFSLVYK